jgi:hypothetical protein
MGSPGSFPLAEKSGISPCAKVSAAPYEIIAAPSGNLGHSAAEQVWNLKTKQFAGFFFFSFFFDLKHLLPSATVNIIASFSTPQMNDLLGSRISVVGEAGNCALKINFTFKIPDHIYV